MGPVHRRWRLPSIHQSRYSGSAVSTTRGRTTGRAPQVASSGAGGNVAREPLAHSKQGARRSRGAASAYPRQTKSRALGPTVTTTSGPTSCSNPVVANCGARTPAGRRPAIALARDWSPSGFRDRVCAEAAAHSARSVPRPWLVRMDKETRADRTPASAVRAKGAAGGAARSANSWRPAAG